MYNESSSTLSPREFQMIGYAAKGLSLREIGDELDISPRTAQKQMISLLKKMGARNKTHMVAMALAQNLIAPPPVARHVQAPASLEALRIAA